MPVLSDVLRYQAMIGIGGIGAGTFFAIEGNRTLGREESRGGRFLNQRDYCKLHIVSHYVSTLLNRDFNTIAIGRVGEDDAGSKLLREMEECGIDLQYVQRSINASTLFSFCFSYPDGSGGNLTSSDSASSQVTPEDVHIAEVEFRRHEGAGIALSVPEVPMDARKSLLSLGTKYGFLRVASFTSQEIGAAQEAGFFEMLDLLALNLDEAATVAGLRDQPAVPLQIAEEATSLLSQSNPGLQIVITAGAQGSWGWEGKQLRHTPPIPIEVVNSAGAGDAYLAGTLVGLSTELTLPQSQQLGNLVATVSATSPHTIDFRIDRKLLANFVQKVNLELSSEVDQLLGIC